MHSATILVDLGYGDAGKGSITDWLCRQASNPLVVRFNGGPQAAHNVVTPDGRHHTFAQFGAGTFVPGVRTHLSRFMLVNPMHLLREAEVLASKGVTDALDRLTLSPECIVITPYLKMLNRARALANGHGTCAQGIGEAMRLDRDCPEYTIRAGYMSLSKLVIQRDYCIEAIKEINPDFEIGALPSHYDVLSAWRDVTCRQLSEDDYVLRNRDQLVFEGAQGVLLDEHHGFHPYTTWSTTTFENADTLLHDAAFDGEVRRLGLLRSYSVRHGPGPFVPERSDDYVLDIPESHNGENQWQGRWRTGPFDLMAARYAADIARPDQLVLTHMDMVRSPWPVITSYVRTRTDPASAQVWTYLGDFGELCEQGDFACQEALTRQLAQCVPVIETWDARTFVDRLSAALEVPVKVQSHGPTWTDKVEVEELVG